MTVGRFKIIDRGKDVYCRVSYITVVLLLGDCFRSERNRFALPVCREIVVVVVH